MTLLPDITVSSLDLQRLETLIARLPASKEVAALQDELDRAKVVAPAQLPPNVVSMNSTVRFAIEESGEHFTRTLAYPHDVQPRAAKAQETVSVLAPVGSALLGLSVGSVITWPLPGAKTQRVRIVDITYQPERNGDFAR
jgi:regulator of nucleoside diphosphate kinase